MRFSSKCRFALGMLLLALTAAVTAGAQERSVAVLGTLHDTISTKYLEGVQWPTGFTFRLDHSINHTELIDVFTRNGLPRRETHVILQGHYSDTTLGDGRPLFICDSIKDVAPGAGISVSISPASASMKGGETQTFTATAAGGTNGGVTWSVQEGSAGGSITDKGAYTAPSAAGTYHLIAASTEDPTRQAVIPVTVEAGLNPIVLILVGLAGVMFIAFICVLFLKPKTPPAIGNGLNPGMQPLYPPVGGGGGSGPLVPGGIPPIPSLQGGQGAAPASGGMEGRTLFIGPTSGETVFLPDGMADGTISFLTAYFEVVSGGGEDRGSRKELYSLRGNHEFGIGRVDERKDYANYIPIRSATVSRDSNKQGKLLYDPATGQYMLLNLADPGQGKNPIRINSYPLAPGEERRLTTGDIVDVGEVKLKFYEGLSR